MSASSRGSYAGTVRPPWPALRAAPREFPRARPPASRALPQERSHLAAHEGVVHRATTHGRDATAAVDHEGLRKSHDPEALACFPVAVAQHRIAQLVLADEVPRVSHEVQGVHSQHRPATALHALVPAIEQWRLLAARLAPGGPEVEYHDLAAVVLERLRTEAGQPRQLQRRRRRALPARERLLDITIRLVGRQPVREQRYERQDGADHGDRNGGENPPHMASRRVVRAALRSAPFLADVAHRVERQLPKL